MAGGVPAKILREGAYPRVLTPPERRGIYAEVLGVFRDMYSGEQGAPVNGDQLAVRADDVSVIYEETLTPERASLLAGSLTIVLTDACRVDAESLAPELSVIEVPTRRLLGRATAKSERLVDQLRRYGTRFRYEAVDGRYAPWT